LKHLTLFRIVYLILLGFVLIDFCLSIFGLSFTPILWDSWLFLLVITLFIRFCRHLVILDLLFGIFGIQFIPMIFKTGQFVPIILAIVHILSYCFKERYRLFEGIRSAICSLYIWIFVFVIFAFVLATIPAYHGYYMKGGALDVGKASTISFVWTSVAIIIIDFIITQILLT